MHTQNVESHPVISKRQSDRIEAVDARWHKVTRHIYRERRLLRGEIGQPPNVTGRVVIKFLPDGQQIKLAETLGLTRNYRHRRQADRVWELLIAPISSPEAIERIYGEKLTNIEAVVWRGSTVVRGSETMQ